MYYRSLFLLFFFLQSACVAQKPAMQEPAAVEAMPTDTVGPPDTVGAAEQPDKTVPEPDTEDLVPDACELLLLSLQETQPLLRDLDESLASQAERFEASVGRLAQPAAGARASECPEASDSAIGNKEIIGAIEWIYMDPPGKHYRARVDSAADTSSLSASEVIEFERDGDDWVRFNFQLESTDEPVHFELPIKRTVVARDAAADKSERRFVVEIDIRLGNQLHSVEFTLTDRSNLRYPILLGRAFLMDLYVIDVSRSYTRGRFDPT